MPMNVRPLGSTGLYVTPLGLGLAALGRPAYINLSRDSDLGSDRSVAAMERRCHDMLDAAYSAGIRYVDAARSYGLAEMFLSSWLEKSHPAANQAASGAARGDRAPQAERAGAGRGAPATSQIDAVAIGSKWGYTYTGGWQLDAAVHEVKDLSVETLRRQFAESRSLLRDRLGLYQIHSATLESGVLDDRRVLTELTQLRSEGLAIGLTVSGPKQADVIRRALDVNLDGVNPFQCVQATWNLLETSAGSALADAKARGWGVIVKEVLANGRLTDRHPGPDAEPVRRQAKALNITLDAASIAAALSQPWADVVLLGAVTRDQLRSNLSALAIPAVDWPSIAQPPSEYWSQRSTMTWH